MTDNLKPEQRRRNMQNIRGRHTGPEMIVRRFLHRLGFRFRLHVPTLPGRPDIVLPRHHLVILVHGCFWHRHGCRWTPMPATREEAWLAKFDRNIERDSEVKAALETAGWRVVVIWSCE
ncbi:MAG: DNA mismatch endonuclease Vsr, partial [Armatimonadetes bacterium]|nr:DNA mismatch endonuclease Vsr [Armatimonadota bacterium]